MVCHDFNQESFSTVNDRQKNVHLTIDDASTSLKYGIICMGFETDTKKSKRPGLLHRLQGTGQTSNPDVRVIPKSLPTQPT